MINNLLQTSFPTLEIISQFWQSEISKRDKLIGAVAIAILALVSLYGICRACLRDRSIKPLDDESQEPGSPLKHSPLIKKVAEQNPQDVDESQQGKGLEPTSEPKEETILEWNANPLDIRKLGMNRAEYCKSFPQIRDAVRYGTRDMVIEEICNFLDLSPDSFEQQVGDLLNSEDFSQFIDYRQTTAPNASPTMRTIIPLLSDVKLFTSKNNPSRQMSRETQLLGRFDVLAVPCIMDFDAQWNLNRIKQTLFHVHHAAAINIGESAKAEDYSDYALANGSLDKEKYLKDMSLIFHQMLAAQEACGTTDAVWFPFGMGAFLRHLDQLDSSYKDPQQRATLKQEIAKEFVKEALNFPTLHIHMCLPLDDEIGSGTQQNYNAIVQAFSKHPEIHDRLAFYINTDATDLAQRLANQNLKVSLANGANRNLIGNHWFQGKVRTAIDENLHRRSCSTAFIALLLNHGVETIKRDPNELINRVKQFKGQVLEI